MKGKFKNNIPNMITTSRLISSMLSVVLFISGNFIASFGCYIYGAISDALDGFAARKLKAFTKLGRKLDPLSDKIYAASLLLPAVLCGNLLMLAPMALELKIALTNLDAQKKGYTIETERVGKFKTASLFPTMIIGLLSTIEPALLIVLYPFLGLSTYLQLESIKAYKNQITNKELADYKNKDDVIIENSKKSCEHNSKKKMTKLEKMKALRNELDFYINNGIEENDYNKIKIRKK